MAQGQKLVETKVQRIMKITTDTAEMRQAICTLDNFYRENTLASRRSLKRDLEKRSLVFALDFIAKMEPIEKLCLDLESKVSSIVQECNHLEEKIRSSEERSQEFLNHIETLMTERSKSEEQSKNATEFLTRFQLSPEEIHYLLEAPIESNDGKSLFAAFDRLDEIKEHCSILLNSERASDGLDILERVSYFQNNGLERIIHWVQNYSEEIMQLSTTGQPSGNDQSGIKLKIAAKSLKVLERHTDDYESLFMHMMNARRAALIRRFIVEVSRGGPNGHPPPIEITAQHDPVRYVGDLLAWIHEAVVSEKDALLVILFDEEDINHHIEPEKMKKLLECINLTCSGIQKSLQSRLEHVISSHKTSALSSSVVTLFRVQLLLIFYIETLSLVTSTELELINICARCRDYANEQLLDSLNQYGKRINDNPADELLQSLQNCVATILSPEEFILPILDAIVEPLLKTVETSTQSLDTKDAAVFFVNNLNTIKNTLKFYVFTQQYLKSIERLEQEKLDCIIQEQTESMLQSCELKLILLALEAGQIPLSLQPGCDANSLQTILRKFYALVLSLTSQLERLQSTKLRSLCRKKVAENLASAYELLFNAINDPDNMYEQPEIVCAHSPEQIRMLLDVEDPQIED